MGTCIKQDVWLSSSEYQRKPFETRATFWGVLHRNEDIQNNYYINPLVPEAFFAISAEI